jgi:hypothetical protein
VVVVVIKLEGYQGKEITIEELVVQYYKDPDKYFEVIINVKPRSVDGIAVITAIVVAKTSIALVESWVHFVLSKEGNGG